MGMLSGLAKPSRAFAAALVVSLLISMLAGNAIALLAAIFTLVQVVAVTLVVAFFLILVGVFAEGLSR